MSKTAWRDCATSLVGTRPRTLDDQCVADLLNKTLQTRPAKQTHWSVRSFAAEANISKDMARRLFCAASIAPHRCRSFKLSNDPAFVEKVRDITGLYLNPPDHALVLCVDDGRTLGLVVRVLPQRTRHIDTLRQLGERRSCELRANG